MRKKFKVSKSTLILFLFFLGTVTTLWLSTKPSLMRISAAIDIIGNFITIGLLILLIVLGRRVKG